MRYLKAAVALAALLSLWTAAPASAEVNWWTTAEFGPSTLEPGGKGQVVVYTRNYGTSPSNLEGAKIVDQLPVGVIATGVHTLKGFAIGGGHTDASCSGGGSATVSCSITGTFLAAFDGGAGGEYGGLVPRGPTVIIDVRVSPSATGVGTNTVTVSGGGDPTPAIFENQVPFGKAALAFGVNPSSYVADVFDPPFPTEGAPYRQAGGHPGDLRLNFTMNDRYEVSEADASEGFLDPVGRLRTVTVSLPRGLIGNPEAVPKCPALAFLKSGQDPFEQTGCPPDSQVGMIDVQLGTGSDSGNPSPLGAIYSEFSRVPLYNLEAPKGTPIDLGYQIGGFATGHVYASLDASRGYAIRAESPYTSQVFPVRAVRVSQWGVPGDPAHDLFRGRLPVFNEEGVIDLEAPSFGASFTSPIKPFFTNPSDCGVDNGGIGISVDSWNHPGEFTPELQNPSHLNVTGCDDERIRFRPEIALQPTSRAAGGPTGLSVHLDVPQRDQTVENAEELYSETNLHGVDTPPMKKAVVTLPEGMTLSTSAAQGLTGCSTAEIGLGTNDPVRCPDASQYGELTLRTPVLPKDEPMHGYIYVAKQSENPFGTFLALYLVIEDPGRGLRVKIPGRIDLDQVTGQITTTFDDLPQFPVSEMELSLKGGVRAGLVNPTTCGQKTISATFYSWADPTTPISETSSFDVTQKPDGSPCVQNLGDRPFKPTLDAGTFSNSAGSYSPLIFRLTRSDDDQEFSRLAATLPPGLTSKIAGVAKCSEAGIAQAESRTAAGDGGREQLTPSCPASSQIGTAEVGSGVGQALTYLPGKVYLAGPYKGAPLSFVVITPVVAGPYDLGVVAVRAAIDLDPVTAQVTTRTDPFPQIYQGIPVRLRDIRVSIDRPQTTLNPTSCDPMAFTARVSGTGSDLFSLADDPTVNLSQRFQAANCGSLGFRPRVALYLSGGTRRTAHPKLRAVVRPRPGDANFALAQVTLPRSEFLDQSHLNTICTRVQFAAGAGNGSQCPAGSLVGHAAAATPLLDETLEGPVFLRSSSHTLPDLVVALHGPHSLPVNINLASRIDQLHGGIRSSFEGIPDVPVTRFVLSMQGGKKGLLQNSAPLCGHRLHAIADLRGQNGQRDKLRPLVRVKCRKGAHHRKAGGRKGGHRPHRRKR